MAQSARTRKTFTKAGALLERYRRLREEDGDMTTMDGLPPVPTSQDFDLTSDGTDNTPDAEDLFPFPQEGDLAMDGEGEDAEDDMAYEADEDDDDWTDEDEEGV